ESELAGVMAHEIAHVCARHQTRNATKANIMQIASIPLIMTLPGTWAGYGIYEGMNFAIPMTYLKFGRDAEREADYLGLQYMYKAGYDPNAFVAFFEKVEAEEKKQPGTIPKIFETHPPTPDRIIAAQKEIASILPPRPEYIVTTSEFDTVKARLLRLESGERIQQARAGKPTLKSKAEQKSAQTLQGQTDSGDDNAPVLKRRPN
ncbi:MAG: M48 family metalloprotease, partial [Candidatus Acidiferrales bacterium]